MPDVPTPALRRDLVVTMAANENLITDLDSQANPHLTHTFNALQIVSLFVIIPALLTAIYSSRIRRNVTWYIFLGSWAVNALNGLLIIGQQSGAPPPYSLCFLQATTIYSVVVYGAAACLAYVLQLYFSIRVLITQGKPMSQERILLLVLAPIIITIGITAENMSFAINHPETVTRHNTGMFCHLSDPFASQVAAVLLLLFAVFVFIYIALSARTLYYNWAAFRRFRSPGDHGVSVSALVRISLFSAAVIVPTVMCLLFLFVANSNRSPQIAIVIGSLPLVTGLILGTQQDTLLVLMFWKRDQSPTLPSQTAEFSSEGDEKGASME